MKDLGRIFRIKGLVKLWLEVGKSLLSLRNRKVVSGGFVWVEGRMMEERSRR